MIDVAIGRAVFSERRHYPFSSQYFERLNMNLALRRRRKSALKKLLFSLTPAGFLRTRHDN